jgi:hypothetical protein
MEYWEKNKHFPNPLKESNVFPSMKLDWKTKTALFFFAVKLTPRKLKNLIKTFIL